MSKKVVFPLLAICSLTFAAGSIGCKASGEAKFGVGENQAAAEPAPEPAPPPPAEPAPPPEVKAADVVKPLGKAKIEGDEIKIPGKIKFDFNKSAIKEDADTKEILKTVAEMLKENPKITKLRVEGHTDDKGTTEFNHKLGQARAEAVVAWLEKHGVEKGRLEAKGLGEEHPLVANDTDANREQNRRVEFHIWELEGKELEHPTAASAGK